MKSLMRLQSILLLLCVTLVTYLPLVISAKPMSLEDYFDKAVSFDPSIPTPESSLGYQVGEWHVRHDQIVKYMELLAEKSPRMSLEVIGYSHEQRPLLLMTVANEQRLANIDTIRQNHIDALSGKKRDADAPAVVWMGYSVHGNEASGSNAALLFAYYLAAAQGPEIDKMLNDLVILIDPSLNPDGLNRFASWVNSHQGSVENLDPNDREHIEAWPRGRTNHYWFDLNRDWLLLRHPESRARVEHFHKWKPNVLTDFHEMGPNATYFFQPGIPTRKNPWTPNENVALTEAIAQHHVHSFDQQGVLYFSHESFDDFYYGKGSTYPDVNGGVGILFEQASARGFAQDTVNGVLRFPQAIKNQLTASLSTLSGAIENRARLLAHQAKFYQEAESLADKDNISGYVIQEKHDKSRLNELLALLKRHQIKAYPLTKSLEASNKNFAMEHSYFVPVDQPQYRLIKSIFSDRKEFEDNTFYDVSTWNLAFAFNIEYAPIKSSWGLKTSSTAWQPVEEAKPATLKPNYAYAFAWDDQKAAKMLAYLLKNDIKMRVASKDFTASVLGTGSEGKAESKRFSAGTLIVNRGLQTNKQYLSVLNQAQTYVGMGLETIVSGSTAVGSDLGSRLMKPVYLPQVMIIGGRGSSSYEVGEIWHFMNKQMHLAPSIIEQERIDNIDLSKYTHIYLSSGNFDRINQAGVKALTAWVKNGGVIWGQKTGAQWLIKKKILDAEYMSRADMAKRFDKKGIKYGDRNAIEGKQRVAGAIFSVDLDLTHPLALGYYNSKLPVFKNSTFLLKETDEPYVKVASYSKFPQLSGYADKTNVDKIANSTFMIAQNKGAGLVIGVTDNVNFRGFWYGTSRLMANSLYFSNWVDAN